jgi:Ca2+-binding EF-hand superfamily protein
MSYMQNMHGMRKSDPGEAAQSLFDRLDSSGQGYIEKTDIVSAIEQASSSSETSLSSSDESDIEEFFTQLDSDGDGKVTEEEFTNSLANIESQISNLFSQMRMEEAMGGMMPPPPPPPPEGGDEMNDLGFTEEELTAQLEEIGDSDSKRSALIENILANFEEADSDGDGRVNLNEAMAFDQTTNGSADSEEMAVEDNVALQLMRIIEAYGMVSDTENETSSTLSVTA